MPPNAPSPDTSSRAEVEAAIAAQVDGGTPTSIQRALAAVRAHLGMDVAYLSEFVDGQSVFRHVDAPGLAHLAKPGDAHSLDDVYCNHIIEGRLPQLMPDTSAEPLAVGMPITAAVPIGSHMSIPIHRPDGEPYGMFCCLSAKPNTSLNDRDLATMRMFADLAAEEVCRELAAAAEAERKAERLRAVMADGSFGLVFQPIVDLETGRTGGYEALSRFAAEPYRPPDRWFADASEAGLGTELEVHAILQALRESAVLEGDVYVSVNASPATILDGALHRAVLGRLEAVRHRLVLEVTEHEAVPDYPALHEALAPLRAAGIRLAIDDAGAGYASLSHILQLRPDIIKLDMSLVRDVDTDGARRSLAAAMVRFAADLDIAVVAEGVETAEERAVLLQLGAGRGQGYHFARPKPAHEAFGVLGEHVAAARA